MIRRLVAASAIQGSAAAAQRVRVVLPEGAALQPDGVTYWMLWGLSGHPGIQAAAATDDPNVLEVTFDALPEGHYSRAWEVSCWAVDPTYPGAKLRFAVNLEVDYDVSAAPPP